VQVGINDFDYGGSNNCGAECLCGPSKLSPIRDLNSALRFACLGSHCMYRIVRITPSGSFLLKGDLPRSSNSDKVNALAYEAG